MKQQTIWIRLAVELGAGPTNRNMTDTVRADIKCCQVLMYPRGPGEPVHAEGTNFMLK